MAIAMVLHREPSRLPLDPYVVEYRREIWAHLCHADVTLSVLLGRPLSVIPTYHDTQPPSNVSLHLLQENVNTIEAQPMNEPTTSTYLVLRRRLADIVASIVVNFQTTYRTPDYDKITALSTDLTKFRDSLPPHFRMDDPDKSQDESKCCTNLCLSPIWPTAFFLTISQHSCTSPYKGIFCAQRSSTT